MHERLCPVANPHWGNRPRPCRCPSIRRFAQELRAKIGEVLPEDGVMWRLTNGEWQREPG